MGNFIFTSGPQGRGIMVDDNGALIATGDELGSSYIFTYGDTGRALSVDASGRLKVNMSLITGEFQTLQSASGITPDINNYNNFYVDLSHNATVTLPLPGNTSKYMFIVKQAVGNKSISFTNVIWANGEAVSLTQASGSVDAVYLAYIPQLNKYMADFRLNWTEV